MREGPQNVQIALLLAGPRVRVLDMLAQRAIGTRCSRPLVASQPKQAAQTACSCAMQARGLQSTADGSAGGRAGDVPVEFSPIVHIVVSLFHY